MRFLYKLLLGLIIFNAMLILFSGYFPDSGQETYATTPDDGYTGYKSFQNANIFSTMWTSGLTTGVAVFGMALLFGVLAKQVALFAGIGAFIAVFTGLWAGASGVIFNMTNAYPMVHGLAIIITICIGVIAVFSVVEMLNGQRGMD